MRLRSLRLGALAALIAVLAGCVPVNSAHHPSPSPHTGSQVLAEFAGLPEIGADLNGGVTGLPGQNDIGLSISVTDAFTGDLSVLYRYAVAQAWSVTDWDRPTTGVRVTISRDSAPIEIAPFASALGWSYVSSADPTIAADDVAARFGPWPGPPPGVPEGLGSPAPTAG